MTGEKLVDSFFSSFFNSKSEGGREKDYHYVDSLLFAVFFFFFPLIVFARSSPVWMRAELLSKIHPSPSYPLKKTLQISVSTNSNFFFFFVWRGDCFKL